MKWLTNHELNDGADLFELNDSETQNDHADDVSALYQIYGKDDDDFCEDWSDEVENWAYICF